MKRITFIIVLNICFLKIYGQNKIDNYSFMNLYITNDMSETFLLGSTDSWEITGARYHDTLSILDFVDWMGQRVGINLKNIRLRGLLTFHYSYRSNPTLMHYYTAEYKSGKLVLPEGCERNNG